MPSTVRTTTVTKYSVQRQVISSSALVLCVCVCGGGLCHAGSPLPTPVNICVVLNHTFMKSVVVIAFAIPNKIERNALTTLTFLQQPLKTKNKIKKKEETHQTSEFSINVTQQLLTNYVNSLLTSSKYVAPPS